VNGQSLRLIVYFDSEIRTDTFVWYFQFYSLAQTVLHKDRGKINPRRLQPNGCRLHQPASCNSTLCMRGSCSMVIGLSYIFISRKILRPKSSSMDDGFESCADLILSRVNLHSELVSVRAAFLD